MEYHRWENVQNVTSWLLEETDGVYRFTHNLQMLHLLPVCYQTQFKVLAITCKALHGFGHSYLWDSLSLYALPWQLHSVNVSLPVSKINMCFSIESPILWNGVPKKFWKTLILLTFCKLYKTKLFKRDFDTGNRVVLTKPFRNLFT